MLNMEFGGLTLAKSRDKEWPIHLAFSPDYAKKFEAFDLG
jgi:hypothetical protein